MGDSSRYRVVRLIKRGGMAEILEAVLVGERGFERKVAIKRPLKERLADESFVQSFIDEARIASQLHHPNIVGIVDFGATEEGPFQALELIDGLDVLELESRLTAAGKKISSEIALHVVTEIAHGLAYAHAATDAKGRKMEIVHRDVTPANILVSWAGEVKLADFGIALAAERLAAETRVGIAKGKLEYMSPEQMVGDEVDHRADIFALGCVLHRLITGASPLDIERVRQSVAAGRSPDLHADLEDDVRTIITRATRVMKNDRYATALAFANDTEAALVRRVHGDPRSTLRDLMASVRDARKSMPPPAGAKGPTALLVGTSAPPPREGTKRVSADFSVLPDAELAAFDEAPAATTRAELEARTVLAPAVSSPALGGSRSAQGGGIAVPQGGLRGAASPEEEPLLSGLTPIGAGDDDAPSKVVTHPDEIPVGARLRSRTLAQLIAADGPLATERVLSIAQQLAIALRDMHARGAIHRHVRPANVLLIDSPDRERAELTSGDKPPTQSAEFLPPEMNDPRIDLYAFGVLIYTMLDGRAPSRDGERTRRLPSSDTPAELALRGRLERIAERLASREPSQRPTAETVEAELRQLVPGAIVDPDPTEALGRREAEASEPTRPPPSQKEGTRAGIAEPSMTKTVPSRSMRRLTSVLAFSAALVLLTTVITVALLSGKERSTRASPPPSPMVPSRPEPRTPPREDAPPVDEHPAPATPSDETSTLANPPSPSPSIPASKEKRTGEKRSPDRAERGAANRELADLSVRLRAAASARGVSLEELARADEQSAALLMRWRAASGRDDVAAARAEAEALMDRLGRLTFDPSAATERLKAVHARMKSLNATVPNESMKVFELRYLDLRSSIKPTLTPAEVASVLAKIQQLDSELLTAARGGR